MQLTDNRRLKEYEAKALQHWIAELPAANPGLVTRLIHDFIIEFNAIEMGAQLRLDALELIRPSVTVLEDYLRARLIKTGFPKEENDIKIMNLLVSIEKEFTIGYWIALKELTQRDIGWFQGKNAALSIQRIILGLSSIVTSHFIMGMPVPDWIWLDLHSFYKLSVKIKKDTTRIADNSNRFNKKSSPDECYKQILLLSLADPTGLMQKEILLVYSFIETIVSLVGLKSEPVYGQPNQCIILTDEDKPPHYQLEVNTKRDSIALYVDFCQLSKAMDHTRKFISATEARFSSMYILKNTREKPSAELLDYLNLRWFNIDLQQPPLFEDRLDRFISIGLTSTYDLQKSQESSDEKAQEFLAQSASDRLLSCVFKQTGVLSVGSLISFRKADLPKNQRLLGVVDKIVVAKKSGKLCFGLQLLASQINAVTYLELDATENAVPKKGQLYYLNEKDAVYIITDTFILKDGDIIRLFVNNENYPIALKNRKNIGLGYWQFKCMRVTENIKPPQTKKGYDFI
jgi:hypothetical protein